MFAQAAIQASAVKRMLQEREGEESTRAGPPLFISRRRQPGIKHIIFQRSVHFSIYRLSVLFFFLCFPYARLRGEQLCGRLASLERGELISVGEVEQNAKKREEPANKQAARRPRRRITIRHGNNTSRAVTAVIWKQIDGIYKLSACLFFARRPLRPQSAPATFLESNQTWGKKSLVACCCRLLFLVLYVIMEIFKIFSHCIWFLDQNEKGLGPTLGGYKHVGGYGWESLAGVYVDMDGFGCVLIIFCCWYIFFLFFSRCQGIICLWKMLNKKL